MADSTRAMRRSVFERDVLPAFRNRTLTEIVAGDIRVLCRKVKDRGAPVTAIHARDIIKLVYDFAILHGEKVSNPAEEVGPASIATFVPKDRSLSPTEIRVMLESFTVHDLRRTGSTLLNEVGFNSDWIEKCLAHEDGRSSHGIYNKAEYEPQRRHMLQEWANLVDAWVTGCKYSPTLFPRNVELTLPGSSL